MLKKIGIYSGLIILGLVFGYFIFGGTNDDNQSDTKESSSKGKWTCSMHPEVNGTEGASCPLCSMELVYMEPDTGTYPISNGQFKMSENALRLANIETSKVGYGDDDKLTTTISGVITTNHETDATQTTLFGGRIDKLYTNSIGTKISKGQELGVIYSPDLYLGQNKLLSSVSYRESHPNLFNEARNTMGLWKMTDPQIEQMLADKKPMMNFPIYADVSGTIMEIMASEGNFYGEGETLFKISDLRTVWAIFDAYENQLPFLKKGQEVILRASALTDDSRIGTIDFIEPILDKRKRTTSVRVVLDNKAGKLKPGMFIEAQIKTAVPEGKITIPKTAVLWTGKRSLVYLKPNPDVPVFEMAEVILGQSLGDTYEILSGLKIGDNIVTEGTFTIDAVAQLQGKKSMMKNIDTEGDDDNHPKKDKDVRNNENPIDFKMILKNDFEDIIEYYVAMKDAFVSSDPKKVQEHANQLSKKLQKLNLETLSEDSKNNIELLISSTKSLITTDDLKKQRLHFKSLSETLVEMVSKSKNLNETIYVQFCPMADQNKGAKWLSFEKNIKNPYFGDKMLTCGSVLEEIK